MGRVSRWAVRNPILGIGAWIAIMIVVGVLGTKFAGSYNDSFALPDTQSTRAQNLLQQLPGGGGAGGFNDASGKIVWQPSEGTATDPGTKATMTALFTQIAATPGVACVVHPYGEPLGTQCPKSQTAKPANGSSGAAKAPTQPTQELSPAAQGAIAAVGPAGISPDKSIAFATVSFKGAAADVPTADVLKVFNDVKAANGTQGLVIGLNGSVFDYVGMDPPSSEGIGIMVALIILLFAFGSLLGAFLPILSAVISLSSGLLLVTFAARFLDVATFAPTLAAMIGLGVGIDYSLFVINRYRAALIAGRSPRDAATESVNTSGRAVQFAATTVIIALFGLFVMKINFFNGLAVAAGVTVLLVMLGALILLPSVLSLLGTRAFAGRMVWVSEGEAISKTRRSGPAHTISLGFRYLGWVLALPVTVVGYLWRLVSRRGREPVEHHGNAFASYGSWLQKRPWLTAGAALAVMVIIALPTFSIRLGFADDSGKPVGSPSRVAYDLLAKGFGEGVNGPFFVAQKFARPGDTAAYDSLVKALNKTPGVAFAGGLPPTSTASVTAIQVTPTTAPQDQATSDLLSHLRSDVIPAAIAGTGSVAYVGGTLAITEDFTSVLVGALPLFLLVVVGLGFLALVFLFRSIIVPLTGALTSLLSLGAALGVTVAVFQWGWAASLLGVQSTGPIMPFLPVMVFAILFGLSMDYQVFLVSRMQEEWAHTGDNRKAVRRGLAGSGRVVAIAAAIMTSVFAAFVLGSDSTIKLFGLSLSTAVLLDAFVVRLVLVPSLMTIIGKANWWLPGPLAKILPHVAIEAEDEATYADEIPDVPEDELAPVGRG